MPVFHVQVKAYLENVKHIIPKENNLWKFDVEGTAGGDKREGVTCCEEELTELEGSRGSAHLVLKLHGKQGEQSSLKILPRPPATPEKTAYPKAANSVQYSIRNEDSEKWVSILALECRGLEPTKVILSDDFEVISESDTKYDNVEIVEGETWTDFDEGLNEPITIDEISTRIIKV